MQRSKQEQPARKKDYKANIDAEEQRKKRNDTQVKIRKNRKEENILKKRNFGAEIPVGTRSVGNDRKLIPEDMKQRIEMLPQMFAGVVSNDPQLQIEATAQFRKLLSIERNPPIEEVIATGVIPHFVQFLTRHQHPILQFEAAWALTNVASGSSEQTRVVIDAGAVPILVQLLGSPNDDVREQAVWALGNIAGDSPLCRDYVLQCQAMLPLLQNLNDCSRISMLRNATWSLSNFCRGKPPPPFEHVKSALPILARLIQFTDEEVLTDSCWALSYLSDGTNDRIQAVIESGVCRRLVELLSHSTYSVQTPALRTVGNIVTGDDIQTQVMLNVGVMACLQNLLQSPKKGIRKEACWTISNVTAGNKLQIQAVIDGALIPPLINLLNTAEFDIKKEAAWAISNATSGGTPEQMYYLVNEGCLKPLCDLLMCNDVRIILVALEGIENILKSAEPTNLSNYIIAIEAADGLEKIENLQHHVNQEIYEKAVNLVEKYFSGEEEQHSDIVESGQQQGAFSFEGAQQPPSGFKF